MDTICVTMPKTFYEFLQAMAVIQDYSVQLAVGAQRKQRDDYYQVTFRMDEKFKYFESCLRVVQDNVPIFDYSGWDEEQRSEFDCFIRFDDEMFQRAKTIAKKLGMHIVSGLNTLVGAGASSFPVLAPLQLKVPERTYDPFKLNPPDVLILNWDDNESNKFCTFLQKNYSHLDTVLDSRDKMIWETSDVKDTIDLINMFPVVIGPKSIATYIATILKKIVIELFSSTEEGILYGVSGIPKYWAVAGQNHSAEFLFHVWETKAWPEYSQEMKSQEEQTSAVQVGSIAETVREKSGDK